jgi:glycine oxidase
MSGALSKSDARADVLIVGGGVIGLSIARELALRGIRNVTVIERGDFGREASWAAGGILGPQAEANCADDLFKLTCASRDLYPAFAHALAEETSIDVELDRTGTLYAGFTEDDERELRRRHEWQKQSDLRVDWLNDDDARRLEANISPNIRCALLFPDDWQVENRKLIEALIASNKKLGVQLMANCDARSIRVEGRRLTGIESSNGFIGALSVVIAAGAWSSCIKNAGTDFGRLKIEPVRGQMLCFKTSPPLAHHLLYSPRGYLVPRRDGRILAGSTSEHAGFEKRVTSEGTAAIKSMAFEIAPALESVSVVDSWSGLRPRAADDLPVLGADEETDGLLFATGHYRNGILLAPITAEIIADLIARGVKSALIESLSPNRFRRTKVTA